MHELSIALEILSIAEEEARRHGAARVSAIRLRVGGLSGVEPSSLAFSFDAVKGERGMTRDAVLAIETVPVRVRCRACGVEAEGEGPLTACPRCRGFDTQLLAGDELTIADLEIETGDAPPPKPTAP